MSLTLNPSHWHLPTRSIRYDREFLLQFMEVCTERPNVSLDFVARPPDYTATGCSNHPGVPPRQTSSSSSKPTRIKRGGLYSKLNYIPVVNTSSNQPAKNQVANMEPVTPLVVSASRWTRKPPGGEEQNVERKVRALLNKLTMVKFDPVSDRIIEWANKSEAEKDGRTLVCVIRLIFECVAKTAFSAMYALLCRKIMEKISPNVQDDGIRDADGKPITGGRLFRKFLLNNCQEVLERGWAAKDATAANASKDTTTKEVEETSGGVEFYSDEYDATQKSRRQALGLVQFISEMFKLQMLTERIMHECIKRFLANVEDPEEEEIESLCRLLTTTGKLLDRPRARGHMDIYFVRMEKLRKNSNVVPRLRFMLQVSSPASARGIITSHCFAQDVIEARERKWIPKDQIAAPTQTDGWSVAGGSTPHPPLDAGDLPNSAVAGPSSVWAGKEDVETMDETGPKPS